MMASRGEMGTVRPPPLWRENADPRNDGLEITNSSLSPQRSQGTPHNRKDGRTVLRNAVAAWHAPLQQASAKVGPSGARAAVGWMIWGLALSSVCMVGTDAMEAYGNGAMVLAGSSGPMSSPAYANTFEQWNVASRRTSTSPVTFRLQAETKFGWEVCVTGGCEALGYWNPEKALLLRTDPGRYPIWEGVGQLPGGCDIEYKYLMRPRGRSLSRALSLALSAIRSLAPPLPTHVLVCMPCIWHHALMQSVTRQWQLCGGDVQIGGGAQVGGREVGGL